MSDIRELIAKRVGDLTQKEIRQIERVLMRYLRTGVWPGPHRGSDAA